MFNNLYRRQLNIKRWGIGHALQPENVAEHSYFVTLYSSMLCDLLGTTPEFKLEVITAALTHDLLEVWMTDIPGPMKGIIEVNMFNAEKHMQEVLDIDLFVTPSAKVIIKVADLLDEALFIKNEKTLGSKVWDDIGNKVKDRLFAAIYFMCERMNATGLKYELIMLKVEEALDENIWLSIPTEQEVNDTIGKVEGIPF